MVLRALLERLLPRRVVQDEQVDCRRLEARLKQLEEEVSFLQALYGPDRRAGLPPPDSEGHEVG